MPNRTRNSDRRKPARVPRADQVAPTYQDLLDESLQETFPASDPISPGVAQRRRRPTSSRKNPTDWTLTPEQKRKPKATQSRLRSSH